VWQEPQRKVKPEPRARDSDVGSVGRDKRERSRCADHLRRDLELRGDGVLVPDRHARCAAPDQLGRPEAGEHYELKRPEVRRSSYDHNSPFQPCTDDDPAITSSAGFIWCRRRSADV
jgi:hypothetical protein